MIDEFTGDGLYKERLRTLIRKLTQETPDGRLIANEDPVSRELSSAASSSSAESEKGYVRVARDREAAAAKKKHDEH